MATATTIVLVEDDPIIQKSLAMTLRMEGYRAIVAGGLEEMGAVLSIHRPSLILLDINLPDGSGLSFLSNARKVSEAIPIVVLTARVDEDSAVQALTLGAEDYIRKPFSNRELLLRIKKCLGRYPAGSSIAKTGSLSVNPDHRRIFCGSQELKLTRRQFDILHYFLLHPGRLVSRDKLLDVIADEGSVADRTIDSHISHVRKALAEAGCLDVKINSVYGSGYRLEVRSDV